jgi:TRAP-type mannitol/chloroaromatic compound transport system permease small subunit
MRITEPAHKTPALLGGRATMAEEVGELDITDELIAERRAEQPGQTPEDMTPWQRPITAFIDVLNLWAGRIICLLLVPLIFVMVFEVVSRTLFGTLTGWGMNDTAIALGLGPTLWAYDISRMTGGVIFMIGAGYALMRGVHIRADFLYRNWTPKTQATVDAVLYMLFYFPAMLLFFWSRRTSGGMPSRRVRPPWTPPGHRSCGPRGLPCRLVPSCSCCRAFRSCSAPFTRWARSVKRISCGCSSPM